ncbi:MAG: cytochrome c [bacterium]|nr:cytochrome c [bacterium]
MIRRTRSTPSSASRGTSAGTGNDPATADWHRKAVGLVIAAAVVVGGCGAGSTGLSEIAAQGREIAATRGCMACHGEDGEGDVGPTWQGLFGSQVLLDGGTTVTADSDYLRRSIVDPESEVVAGVTITMPTASLTDAEVEALVEYIKELE